MATKEDVVVESPDVHFEPVVKLAPVEIKTLEENEDEVFKIRAKLFRFDAAADPPEWKERGTGDVKFLRKRSTTKHSVRLLMRRDKTHKICANHYLTPDMKLMPSAGSDRAFVWNVQADFADEEPKPEQLAIRFKNAENAGKFKDAFEKYQNEVSVGDTSTDSLESTEDVQNETTPDKKPEDAIAEKLDQLTVKETEPKSTDSASPAEKTASSSQETVEPSD
ncbi:ran-specific GTPase-activating protein-like [Halichondria panicea]|uniref:ran-specific GTPase-activating protein-like n=1 Tax=Halichondria panicea TaxID=6063 RepID=UPI00312B31D6